MKKLRHIIAGVIGALAMTMFPALGAAAPPATQAVSKATHPTMFQGDTLIVLMNDTAEDAAALQWRPQRASTEIVSGSTVLEDATLVRAKAITSPDLAIAGISARTQRVQYNVSIVVDDSTAMATSEAQTHKQSAQRATSNLTAAQYMTAVPSSSGTPLSHRYTGVANPRTTAVAIWNNNIAKQASSTRSG